MSEDRFNKALGESDAARLISDAESERRLQRDKNVLETWANWMASRLDAIMVNQSSFGEGRGTFHVDYENGEAAQLTYERQGTVLRMVITANAFLQSSDQFRPGILIGDNFEANSATMAIEVSRADTNETRIDEFRYGLQPVSKLTSIDEEMFLAFVEDLVRRFGA